MFVQRRYQMTDFITFFITASFYGFHFENLSFVTTRFNALTKSKLLKVSG